MPGGAVCCGSTSLGEDPIQENSVVFNYGDGNEIFYIQPETQHSRHRYWIQKSCAKLFVSITEILK